MAGNGTAVELKNAIAAALAADVAVTAIVGARIYEYAQTGEATFPFVTIGTGQETDDSVVDLAASDAFVDVDAYSQPPAGVPSFDEAMTLANAVRVALHDSNLELTSNRCVQIEHRITRYLRDSDPPPVFRAAVTFHAVVEEM